MRWLLRFTLIALAAWAIGFYQFLQIIDNYSPDKDQPCEALVVLTGGLGRIEYGLTLFEQGRAPLFFITGVDGGNTKQRILQRYHISGPLKQKLLMPGVFSIDRKATSTYQNAEETSKWLLDNPITAACLVTSNYHMPRSLVVFKKRIPSVQWIPEPVHTHGYKLNNWWKEDHPRLTILFEFNKFMVAWMLANI